jgi:hypothetical protein
MRTPHYIPDERPALDRPRCPTMDRLVSDALRRMRERGDLDHEPLGWDLPPRRDGGGR